MRDHRHRLLRMPCISNRRATRAYKRRLCKDRARTTVSHPVLRWRVSLHSMPRRARTRLPPHAMHQPAPPNAVCALLGAQAQGAGPCTACHAQLLWSARRAHRLIIYSSTRDPGHTAGAVVMRCTLYATLQCTLQAGGSRLRLCCNTAGARGAWGERRMRAGRKPGGSPCRSSLPSR